MPLIRPDQPTFETDFFFAQVALFCFYSRQI
jgi:hypothetical protein